MKTTEQLKEKFEANPSEWVVLVEYRNNWIKIFSPDFDERNKYQLIHIKHKDILEAYLADNSVEIEGLLPITNGWWTLIPDFIETYCPDFEYRLKEKKDGKQNREDNINININNDTKHRNRTDGNKLNNFQDFGFTADFEGEILKEVDNTLYGIARRKPISWNKKTGMRIIDGSTWITTDLTPIKRPWYEYPENFPILLIRKKVWKMFAIPNFNIRMINEQGWRLATKAELMDLYYLNKE